jgi:hypothetical protein
VRESLPLLPLTLLCCVCVCVRDRWPPQHSNPHTRPFFSYFLFGENLLVLPRTGRAVCYERINWEQQQQQQEQQPREEPGRAEGSLTEGGETRSGWAIWVALNFFEIYITARPSCVCVCVQMARSISQLNFLADYIDNSDDCCWAPSPRQMRLHTPPHPRVIYSFAYLTTSSRKEEGGETKRPRVTTGSMMMGSCKKRRRRQ